MILQRKITIQIEPRGDGGICVWSPEVMGLILSGSDPEKIMAAIWPALVALNEHNRRASEVPKQVGAPTVLEMVGAMTPEELANWTDDGNCCAGPAVPNGEI